MKSGQQQNNTLDLRTAVSNPAKPGSARKTWRPTKRFWIAMAAAGLLVVVGLTIFLIFGDAKSDTERGEAEVKAVMSRVSRHYLLPSDETPALATITDKGKLTSPVFKQAEDGDNVLIYQKYKMAVIYRPSKDRIVAIVPVTIDEPTNITQDR